MTLIRRAAAIGLTLVCTSLAHAADNLKAITEDGRRVILAPDGRWTFDSNQASARPSGGDSPFRPTVKAFSVDVDTAKWGLVPAEPGDGANKRSFRHRTLPLYAMVISDEIPTTTEVVRNAIISNATSAGADPKVLSEEIKPLRGKDVGALRMLVSRGGLDFVFATRYYGDPRGNIQLMCWTGQAIFFKYQADCQGFVDGLVIE